jgi:hypothetical protein
MYGPFKVIWLAACACAALGFCSYGLAQQSAPVGSPDASTHNSADTLQEIVVTATKREESLNRVGLTVTEIVSLSVQPNSYTLETNNIVS